MVATDYILKIISLLGGLALFLFGMDVMGKALERSAGNRLQTILAKMSSTVIRGFFLGLAVTAVIQSSSATTVMVVGFVNSGIMTLSQAVGVIMGSNVGTTVTAWILSLSALDGNSFIVQVFKPTTLAPMLAIVGIVLYMFTKSERKQGIGTVLLGFMALMTGMDMMSSSMEFLENEAWFGQLMISFSNPLLGILAGAILTGIIQSSSASVGILQGLSMTGLVTFGTAIPIILGQNIGTCVTALISTIGANRSARRTAVVHLCFNIVGVTIFCLVFYTINLFFPWSFLEKSANVVGIAICHTNFNLLTTAILLPGHKFLEKLAYIIVPETKEPEKTELLDHRLLNTPSVALQRAEEITKRMVETTTKAYDLAVSLIKNYNDETMEKLRQLEDETDQYEDAIGSYLVNISGHELSSRDNNTLNTLLYTIGDFERIADHTVSIGVAAQEISQKPFSQQAMDEVDVLEKAVGDVLYRTRDAFLSRNFTMAKKVEPQEQVVDSLVRELKSRHIRRVRNGQCQVELGFVLDDLLTAFSRIADHCSNIAVEMIQGNEGRMDAHEYLGALKAGESDESEVFESRFEKYKERYVFPDENANV